MFQDVFILGATGRVGKTLVDQIYEFDVNSNIHKNPTRIIGLASSKLKLYNPDGISPSEAKSFLNRESGESNDSVLNITNSLDYDTKKSNIVFVDATNSDSGDIFKFHSDIIRNTSFGLVTANKNPLVDFLSPVSTLLINCWEQPSCFAAS